MPLSTYEGRFRNTKSTTPVRMAPTPWRQRHSLTRRRPVSRTQPRVSPLTLHLPISGWQPKHTVDNRNTQNSPEPPKTTTDRLLTSSSSYSLENSESQAIAAISTWKVTSVAVTPTASRVTLRCVITDISLSQVWGTFSIWPDENCGLMKFWKTLPELGENKIRSYTVLRCITSCLLRRPRFHQRFRWSRFYGRFNYPNLKCFPDLTR